MLEEHFLNSVSTRIPKKFLGDVRLCRSLEVAHPHTLKRTDLAGVVSRFRSKGVGNGRSCVRRHLNTSVHTLEFDIVAVGPNSKVLSKNRQARQLANHHRKKIDRNACTRDRRSRSTSIKRSRRSIRTTAKRVGTNVRVATDNLDLGSVHFEPIPSILTSSSASARRKTERRLLDEVGHLLACLGTTNLRVEFSKASLAVLQKFDRLNVVDAVVAEQDVVHLAREFVPLLAETPCVVHWRTPM